MPDMERANQIKAIAEVLARIPTGQKSRPYFDTPPPIRGMWATELHDDFGIRVHPDLAKKELVRVESNAGNFGPVQIVTKNAPATVGGGGPEVSKIRDMRTELLDWMRNQDGRPDLAKLADRVVAAEGDPERTALVLADIRREHPDILAMGEDMMRQASAATFE